MLPSGSQDDLQSPNHAGLIAIGVPNTPDDCIRQVFNLMKHEGPDLYGYLNAIILHEDCPVCRMFTHVVKQFEGTESPDTRLSNGALIKYRASVGLHSNPITEDDLIGSEVQNIGVRLGAGNRYFIQRDSGGVQYDTEIRCYKFELYNCGREMTSADPTVRIFQRRDEAHDGAISKEFLRSWLSAWKQVHSAECRLRLPTQQPLDVNMSLLIDVEAMRVVSAPPNARYLALSYVWGSASWLRASTKNIEELQQDCCLQRLFDQLPNTIQDAITLVHLLGERYLWVDSLCIVQDDRNHQMQQIALMGQIYSGALLVIVAAHGRDANAGLPGLRSKQYPSRVVRWQESVHEKARLLSMPPHEIDLIHSSYWNTRAWTMQESKLAELELVFTTAQVFLRCKCGARCSEDQALYVFHFQEDLRELTLETRGEPVPTFWEEFCDLVNNYTARNLSNDRDVLDAFSAVASMRAAKWSRPFWFGIAEHLVGPSMIWRPEYTTGFSRRQHTVDVRIAGSIAQHALPSWSWIGWKGEVLYESRTLEELVELECTDCLLHPLWKPSPSDRAQISGSAPPLCLLSGTAWTATFDIGPFEMHKNGSWDPGSDIIRGDGEVIGHAWMHLTRDRKNQDFVLKSCEVVATCAFSAVAFRRGRQNLIVPQDQEQDKTKWFKVVHLIIVQYNGSGVGERIGSGITLWDDWTTAKPVNKNIILG